MDGYAEELLKDEIKRFFRESLGRDLKDEQIEAKLEGKKHKEFLDLTGLSFQNRRVLDIGSGFGEALMAIEQKRGIVCGIEPDAQRVFLLNLFLKEKGLNPEIVRSVGEYLPFKDEQFDIVHIRDVLEHVDSPKETLREASRVLKKGGHLLITAPNYLYPYEGHYGIFFIPFLPKKLAKCYLRVLRKPVHYIEHLNYITYRWLKANLVKECHIKIVDHPLERWRISEPNLIKSRFRRYVVKIVKHLDIISRNISYFSPSISIVGIKL